MLMEVRNAPGNSPNISCNAGLEPVFRKDITLTGVPTDDDWQSGLQVPEPTFSERAALPVPHPTSEVMILYSLVLDE
jgi:hypothetical protein